MIDEVIAVSDEDALRDGAATGRARGDPGRDLRRRRGARALEVAGRDEMAGKRVVVIVPDSGERYMSLPFFAPA